MPEAAIHKDGESLRPKKKIRFAENFLIPSPAGDAVLAQEFHKCQLGVLVAAPADTRHDSGSFGLGKDVEHGLEQFTLPPFLRSHTVR